VHEAVIANPVAATLLNISDQVCTASGHIRLIVDAHPDTSNLKPLSLQKTSLHQYPRAHTYPRQSDKVTKTNAFKTGHHNSSAPKVLENKSIQKLFREEPNPSSQDPKATSDTGIATIPSPHPPTTPSPTYR